MTFDSGRRADKPWHGASWLSSLHCVRDMHGKATRRYGANRNNDDLGKTRSRWSTIFGRFGKKSHLDYYSTSWISRVISLWRRYLLYAESVYMSHSLYLFSTIVSRDWFCKLSLLISLTFCVSSSLAFGLSREDLIRNPLVASASSTSLSTIQYDTV